MPFLRHTLRLLAAVLAVFVLACPLARAADASLPQPTTEQRLQDLENQANNLPAGTEWQSHLTGPGAGQNAWLMVCAALVLFMTLPGLALFYGGLVRTKNVLSVMAQCMGIAGLVTIIWWAVGYSLVFGRSFEHTWLGPIFGGTEYLFLKGVGPGPNADYAAWASHITWCMYQLMFAIITPALIIGSIAERMKFSAVLLFVGVWMFVVYIPMAHMTWGVTGLMNGVWNAGAAIKSIDFAGGTVVHMSSGWSALLLCLLLGRRMGHGKVPMQPHSLVLCMVGTGMLWFGWYGFNAGSAVAPDGIAANAFATTTLAAAVASFAWACAEWMHKGKPSVLGFCSGAVGGLVVITPACGFVTPGASVFIGILAGLVPYWACTWLKHKMGYDDALDTFGVHAVGGTLGAFITGIFATAAANPNLASDSLRGIVGHTLWLEQLKSMGLTIVLSLAATWIIGSVVKATIGLRAAPEVEHAGLDINEHGEQGYMYAETK